MSNVTNTNTGVREYIGARYVPLIDGEWDNTKAYEPLTVVINQGDSYTSKQYVPVGVEISNSEYWVLTGNFNGSLANLITTVDTIKEEQTSQDEEIASLQTAQSNTATDIANIKEEQTSQDADIASLQGAQSTMTTDIANIKAQQTQLSTDLNQTNTNLTAQLNAEKSARQLEDAALGLRIDNQKGTKAILIGDSYLRNYTNNPGWGDFFAAQTGWDCSARYKAGGAGFVRAGDNSGNEPEQGLNFVQMLTKAHQDHTSDAGDYGAVVVVGGLNDVSTNQNEDSIQSQILAFAQNARTYFPNAKVYIFNPICSNQWMGNTTFKKLINRMNNQLPGGAIIAKNAFNWFVGQVSSLGRGDDIHPNSNGYLYLARMMAQVVMGNTELAREVTIGSADIIAAINAQYPGLTSWGSVTAARLELTNQGYFAIVEVTVNNAANVPSSGAFYAYLPNCLTCVNTQLWLAPSFGTVGGQYVTKWQGIQNAEYSQAYNSNVKISLRPNFNNTGSAPTVANGNVIHYTVNVPLWI